jgi:deoxyribonuclease V
MGMSKWPRSLSEARKVQDRLRKKVRIEKLKKEPEFVAGVDAAFSGQKILAVASLFKFPELVPLEDAFAEAEDSFPYVPGILSFREGLPIIQAVRRLKTMPDVILFDGQGIAHPKGMGIASHLGVLLNIPSIGCAKSRLIGEYKEPGAGKGCWSPLIHKGKIIGAVLRTRDRIKPLFISPGHRIDLEDSLGIVFSSTRRFRIPEPLRRAHALSKKKEKSAF